MIADLTKVDVYVRDLAAGLHNGAINADTDTLAVFLTNDVIDKALVAVKSDVTEIATGNGYDGPVDTHNSAARIDGVIYVGAIDILLIGTGPGAFGPFRNAVLCNLTAPGQPIIGYWDYGASISVSMGEQFALTFGDALLVVG